LQHIKDDQLLEDRIDPRPVSIILSQEQESYHLRIPVNDNQAGFEGEIALQNRWVVRLREQDIAEKLPARVDEISEEKIGYRQWRDSSLLRGGFKVSEVPGLPTYGEDFATIRMTWQSQQNGRYVRTNLARNHTVNAEVIGNRVTRIWLEYLLRNRHRLPEGQLYRVRFHIKELDEFGSSLEEFDALTLYETVRDAWCKEYGIPICALEEWETGTGTRLRLDPPGDYGDTVADIFLTLVLPIVTSLQYGWSEKHYDLTTYVKPPSPNWREALRASRDYVRHRRRWGQWIEYTDDYVGDFPPWGRWIERDKLSNLLFVIVVGKVPYLNARYQEMFFRFFTAEDLQDLTNTILKWDDARDKKKQLLLSPREFAVLSRARETIGELKYGKWRDVWRIDSIPLPSSSGKIDGESNA
jgi:hypothetical protein